MSFSRTLTSASPNAKIGCRAYLCEARRALSEPVVDPMYVLLHFASSLNISYTHPVGICPGYLSIPKKILLPPPAVCSHIRETVGTSIAAWGARSGMWISNRLISHLDVRDPTRPDEMTNLFCRPQIRQPVVRSHLSLIHISEPTRPWTRVQPAPELNIRRSGTAAMVTTDNSIITSSTRKEYCVRRASRMLERAARCLRSAVSTSINLRSMSCVAWFDHFTHTIGSGEIVHVVHQRRRQTR